MYIAGNDLTLLVGWFKEHLIHAASRNTSPAVSKDFFGDAWCITS